MLSLDNDKKTDLIFKTSSFFIFVSKSLSLNNIRFIGNDLKLVSGKCTSNEEKICCDNDNYFLDFLSPCYIDKENMIINDEKPIYGLINIELMYDSNEYPIINLKDSEFHYFNSYDLSTLGFTSLISTLPFGGNINLENLFFNFCYFPTGLVYSYNKIDNLYKDNIEFLSSQLALQIDTIQEIYNFKNLSFNKYNEYFEYKLKSSLFFFSESKALISFEVFEFVNVSNTNLFYFMNIEKNGFLSMKSITLTNLTNTVFLTSSESLGSISIFNITLSLFFSKDSLVSIENTNEIVFDNLKIERSKIESETSGLFTFTNSMTKLKNSFFEDCILFSIISQTGSLLTVSNSTFINIAFTRGIIFLDQIELATVEKSYFSFNNGDFAIIYITKSKILSFSNSLVQNSTLSSIFYSEELNSNQIFDLIIQNNNLRSLWNDDQTVKETYAINMQVKFNFFSSPFYVNYGVDNSLIHFENFYFFKNNILAVFMVSLFTGSIDLEKTMLIDNFYIDTALFQMNFDLEETALTKFTNSYIENIGVNKKKTFYTALEDCNFISFWYAEYSYFNNITFVVTQEVELVSGFFSGSPVGDKLEILNCRFIKIGVNPLYGYKGMLLDSIAELNLVNNTFYNILCNPRTFSHAHGVIYVTGSSGYLYSKNEYILNLHNNSFYNCSCIYGGNIAIISINTVNITNCNFYNSSSLFFGGSFLVISSPNVYMKNILIDKSIGNEGGAIFLKNILNSQISNVTIKNSKARRNGVIYLNNVKEIIVEDCEIYNTIAVMNGGFMFIFQTQSKIFRIKIFNSSAYEGGAFFLHGNSRVFLNEIYISNANAIQAGGISVYEVDTFEITNSKFTNLFSKLEGAAILFSVLKTAMIANFSIENSISRVGILYTKTIDESSIMEWSNISCISTTAYIGSCIYHLSAISLKINKLYIKENGLFPIYLQWSFEINLYLENLTLEQCQVDSNIIFSVGIILKIKNIEMSHIFSSKSIIFAQNTNLNIEILSIFNATNNFVVELENCIFQIKEFKIINPQQFKISFLNSISSVGSLISGYIANISSSDDGQLIFFSTGNLTILNMICENNLGRFLKIYKSNVEICQSNIRNNTSIDEIPGNDISFIHEYSDTFYINLKNVNFTSYHSVSCYFKGYISISLTNLIFKFMKLDEGNELSSALLGFNLNFLDITYCSFINYTNSALHLENENIGNKSKLNIFSSNFLDNQAFLGGAIFLVGGYKLNLTKNLFDRNRATLDENSLTTVEGIGGCIYFVTEDVFNEIFALNSNIFINNEAIKYISTVFSQGKITDDGDNVYTNNSDNGKFLSFPLKTKIYSSIIENPIINIVSGVSFNLKIKILDLYDQLIFFDNSSVFIIKIFQKEEYNTILMENTIGITKQGIVTFTNVKIKTNSKSTFIVSISGAFQGLESDFIFKQKIERQYSFFARECRIGEVILPDLSCNKCPKGEYSFIDPMILDIKYQKCNKCPENSECPGGYIIYPKPGFYRKTNMSTNVVPCINKDACLGAENLYLNNSTDFEEIFHGQCMYGNTGSLCFYCEFGYGRYEKIDFCKKCANINVQVFVRIGFYALFMIIYILLNTHFAENFSKNEKNKQEKMNLVSTFIKMLVNHSQQVSVILLTTQFPFSDVSSIFEASDYASFSDNNAISNDCVIQLIFFEKKSFTILKEIFSMVLPIFFSLISLSLWLFINFILSHTKKFRYLKNKLPKNFKQLLQKLILFLLISAFIFYALILKSCFNLFNCLKLDLDETKTYLRFSPDMQCWGSEHANFIAFLGMPGILIWGLSFPLLLGAILRRNFQQNMLIKDKGLEEIYDKHDQIKKSWVFPVKSNVKTLKTTKINVKEKEHQSDENQDDQDGNKTEDENAKKNQTEKQAKNAFISERIPQINDNQLFQKVERGELQKNLKSLNKHVSSRNQSLKISENEIKKLVSGLNMDKQSISEDKRNLKAFEKLEDIREGKIFEFFYKDFNTHFYYWESLIFFRKFVITFIATLNDTIPDEPKVIILIAFIGFYLNMTIQKKPYKIGICNKLEILSLIALMTSSFCSFIMNSNVQEGLQILSALLALMLNFSFYGSVGALIVVYVVQNMKKKGKNMIQTLMSRSSFKKNKI